MGLLATGLARIRNHPRIAGFPPYLSLLCMLGGILWIFLLPLNEYSRQTYISENALLPGQVHTYFGGSEQNVFRAYRHELSSVLSPQLIEGGNGTIELASRDERAAKIDDLFRNAGLTKTARQPYRYASSGKIYEGENIFAVLHAPRGDGTEAIVLVAALKNVDGVDNLNGVTLLISLSRYFQRWSLWSKDIIFLITEDSEAGPQAWVDAYHSTHNPKHVHNLSLKSGSLQGAVCIDYPFEHRFETLHVSYDGVNGQLPNLDLINTAVAIASGQMGIGTSLQHMHKHDDSYGERLQTLLRGMASQALGHATGPHSVFMPYHIDAITLTAIGEGWQDEMAMGRTVESIFRSLNNLLEHLHQSFFFYLLMQRNRFVSIGTYLPSAMAVGAGYTIVALWLWWQAAVMQKQQKRREFMVRKVVHQWWYDLKEEDEPDADDATIGSCVERVTRYWQEINNLDDLKPVWGARWPYTRTDAEELIAVLLAAKCRPISGWSAEDVRDADRYANLNGLDLTADGHQNPMASLKTTKIAGPGVPNELPPLMQPLCLVVILHTIPTLLPIYLTTHLNAYSLTPSFFIFFIFSLVFPVVIASLCSDVPITTAAGKRTNITKPEQVLKPPQSASVLSHMLTKMSPAQWSYLHSLSLLWTGGCLTVLATLNFSLSIFLGIVTAPVVIVFCGRSSDAADIRVSTEGTLRSSADNVAVTKPNLSPISTKTSPGAPGHPLRISHFDFFMTPTSRYLFLTLTSPAAYALVTTTYLYLTLPGPASSSSVTDSSTTTVLLNNIASLDQRVQQVLCQIALGWNVWGSWGVIIGVWAVWWPAWLVAAVGVASEWVENKQVVVPQVKS